MSDIVVIPTGATGLDFAGWRPGDEIAAHAFVVRYLQTTASGAWKAVTRAEIDFYHSHGVAVLLVLEQGPSDWQQGAPKGHQHGAMAASSAAALGYPKGLPILAAFDSNAVAGDVRAIAYGNAFADEVVAAGYDFGPYADLDVIRVLAVRSVLNWLAGATSWSDPTKPYQPETMPGYELVHVRQIISGSTPNYDNNVVLRPFPAWLPHADPPQIEVELPTTETTPAPFPTPTPGGPPMAEAKIVHQAGGQIALQLIVDDGYTFHGIAAGDVQAVRDIWKPTGEGTVSDALFGDLAAKAKK